MPPLYPKMRERPAEFQINYSSPLWSNLCLAVLGPNGFNNSARVHEASGYRTIGSINTANIWQWIEKINRFALIFPGKSYATFSPANHIPKPGPLTIMCFFSWNAATEQTTFINHYTTNANDGWRILRRQTGNLTYTLGGVGTYEFTEFPISSNDIYFIFARVTGNGGQISMMAARNYNIPTVAAPKTISTMIGAPYQFFLSSNAFQGWLTDVLIWNTILPDSIGYRLADPSNVDLRVDGVPLILPPRRRIWSAIAIEPSHAVLSRRQFGPRVGIRQIQV